MSTMTVEEDLSVFPDESDPTDVFININEEGDATSRTKKTAQPLKGEEGTTS